MEKFTPVHKCSIVMITPICYFTGVGVFLPVLSGSKFGFSPFEFLVGCSTFCTYLTVEKYFLCFLFIGTKTISMRHIKYDWYIVLGVYTTSGIPVLVVHHATIQSCVLLGYFFSSLCLYYKEFVVIVAVLLCEVQLGFKQESCCCHS